MTPHERREQIFRAVFSLNVQRQTDPGSSTEDIITGYLMNSCDEEASDDEMDYIFTKACAIGNMLEDLDREIDEVAIGWKTAHMGRAELNILRLAVYELNYDADIPSRVAVNEAVELAKVYCDRDAPSFINGLLANFVKD